MPQLLVIEDDREINHLICEYMAEAGQSYSYKNLVLDDQAKIVRVNGNKLDLTVKEYGILKLLLIFTNFFSNARKYADTRISVCLEQDTDGVSITFTNDIEADNEIDIDHVFDAFYRGNSRRKEGAGLGLYVVKCLADKLGYIVVAEVRDKQFSVMLRIK